MSNSFLFTVYSPFLKKKFRHFTETRDMAQNNQQWQEKTAFEQEETLTRTRIIKGGHMLMANRVEEERGAERGDYRYSVSGDEPE